MSREGIPGTSDLIVLSGEYPAAVREKSGKQSVLLRSMPDPGALSEYGGKITVCGCNDHASFRDGLADSLEQLLH